MASGLAGRFLAEQGADVVRVEPPGGDPWRAVLPGAFVWDRGKRSVELDLERREDRETLFALLARADVSIETPERASEALLDEPTRSARFPALIHVCLTGYGLDHPWRERPALDLLVAARAGLPHEQPGHREGPIQPYLAIPSYGAAFQVALAVAAALRARLHTGRGQSVDTSLLDGVALLTCILWQWAEDPPPAFAARAGVREPYRPWLYECADGGWLHHMLTAKGSLQVLAGLLGVDPPPSFQATSDAERVRFERDCIRAFRTRPLDHWLALLREHDVPVEPVRPAEHALRDPQALANGAVAELDDPVRGRVVHSATHVRFSRTPGRVGGPPPKPGEHTGDVLATVSSGRGPSAARAREPRESLRHPLEGVRVLDFGHYLAGPFGPMLMADLGADVIKVEPVEGERMRMPAQPFMACQRGKRTVAVDLKRLEGRDIALRLVERADVVHHNHRPGVAERLGIDEESLRRIRPDLVYTHAPAYGIDGPKAHMGGYDQLFQALCGLEHMAGGEGNPPVWVRFAPVDMGNAVLSTIGTLLALYHRDRTGEGQRVDTSLLDAGLWYNADAFLADRDDLPRRPSLDRAQTGLGPDYRIYETAEGWLAVAALFGESWARLCEGVGAAELAHDPRCASHLERVRHRDALGAALEPRFRARPAEAWHKELDAAGVPCEVVDAGYAERWLRDPWALATRRVVEYPQADLGTRLRQFGETLRFSETPQVIQGPPPALGEHTREILSELGVSEARQRELLELGVVRAG